jgi:hypothetical protein
MNCDRADTRVTRFIITALATPNRSLYIVAVKRRRLSRCDAPRLILRAVTHSCGLVHRLAFISTGQRFKSLLTPAGVALDLHTHSRMYTLVDKVVL